MLTGLSESYEDGADGPLVEEEAGRARSPHWAASARFDHS